MSEKSQGNPTADRIGASGYNAAALLASALDRPEADVVADLEAIVTAWEQGRRPAWGPDGHDWTWWAYHLATVGLGGYSASEETDR